MTTRRDTQSGQVGIIIILIMIVLLTIGLSLATQTTKEIFLSNQESESTRVFNAAEAGVEEALATDLTAQSQDLVTGSTDVTGANATVNYSIQKVKTLETRIPQSGTAMVKVADPGVAPGVTSLQVDWGRETACGQTPATLILAIFSYSSSTNPKTTVRYVALSPCDYSDGNTAINTAGTNGYFRTTSVPINATDTLVRVKAFYNDTSVRVAGVGGTGVLPVQSYLIRSTAVNQLGSSNETRSV
jgi:Tfp pilus assembly protein PilX